MHTHKTTIYTQNNNTHKTTATKNNNAHTQNKATATRIHTLEPGVEVSVDSCHGSDRTATGALTASEKSVQSLRWHPHIKLLHAAVLQPAVAVNRLLLIPRTRPPRGREAEAAHAHTHTHKWRQISVKSLNMLTLNRCTKPGAS